MSCDSIWCSIEACHSVGRIGGLMSRALTRDFSPELSIYLSFLFNFTLERRRRTECQVRTDGSHYISSVPSTIIHSAISIREWISLMLPELSQGSLPSPEAPTFSSWCWFTKKYSWASFEPSISLYLDTSVKGDALVSAGIFTQHETLRKMHETTKDAGQSCLPNEEQTEASKA